MALIPLNITQKIQPQTTCCDLYGKTARTNGLKAHKNSIQCYAELESKRLRERGLVPTSSILRRPRLIRLGIPHAFGPIKARTDFKRKSGHILYGLYVPLWANPIFWLRSSDKWTDKALTLCLNGNDKDINKITETLNVTLRARNDMMSSTLATFFDAAKLVNEPFMKEVSAVDFVVFRRGSNNKPHKTWFHHDGTSIFVCCSSLKDKNKTLFDDSVEVTASLIPQDQVPLCWAFVLQLKRRVDTKIKT